MVTKEIKVKTHLTHSDSTDQKTQEVFRREEVKYVITPQQAADLLQIIAPFIHPDKYPTGTNCSIYFDTPDGYLAMHSLEKPLYKEKIRLRSYNVPRDLNDTVFIEIKKKFDGIGNKRRISVKLQDYYHYLKTGQLATSNAQIRRELDYCFKFYHLKPYLYLAYDRRSYTGAAAADRNFRLTFDQNIRYRTNHLRLEHGDQGQPYFEQQKIVMEAKALDSYPIWFARALSQLQIYPSSFSKYGKVCQKLASA